MSIIRNRLVKKFSTIPNDIILDKQISDRALRVYLYLASKFDGWSVNNKNVMDSLGIKDEQTLSNAWKSLIETGWINRVRKTSEDGTFVGGFDYQLNESPNPDNNHIPVEPISGKNPDPVEPISGKNPDHNNNNGTNILKGECNKGENNLGQPVENAQNEKISPLTKMRRESLKVWKQIAEESKIKFTSEEWNNIYGYIIAKPSLQPHEIRTTIFALHKWANEGLDINDSLLTGHKFKNLVKPRSVILTNKNNQRIYGQGIIERRNHIIKSEEMKAKE